MALDEYESGVFKKCQVKFSVFKEIYDELESLYFEVNSSSKHGAALSTERHKVASSGW
jgi:hypothetical protein